ncbi:probable LRR receptor-like serine/threonine-protein kinase RFK1 isoform X2 [Vigna radiata var. radiata]|nr:probable LRR receptor-like serine/threonine-protein kinase RFK1 isoform X2 [Vigna radiata var. radiata]
MLPRILFAFLLFTLSCFRWLEYAECKVPQEEVDALKEITSTMGATYWEFDSDYCSVKMLRSTPDPPKESERRIVCDCTIENNTCHVVEIFFKKVNLPGMLPPQLVKLPYLSKVDFALNYLSGTIPKEWGSTNLTSISVFANHLSGEIPVELGRITTLTYLNLEANQFSGVVPHELGSLFKLELLVLSSNKFSGKLPVTLAKLQNMTEFRISDNNFSGEIPSFIIQNWKSLQRLDMLASGLEGPIPSNISLLSNLYQLRISDINGPSQDFPNLINMTRLKILILRNCHIIGVLPSYLWSMENLEMLDVSFNKLVGKIPDARHAGYLRFLFLTHNMLSGNIPKTVLTDGSSVDLSYNNFTWQGPDEPACRDNLNLNLNLFRSFFGTKLQQILPCLEISNCPAYSHCFGVNCGGKDVNVMENDENVLYVGDGDVLGSEAAKYYINYKSHWGFSSTGDFMDDGNYLNAHFTRALTSSNLPELYQTARVAPLSLTYFLYCLENGKYTVKLHFAEIQFTNDKTYSSLGKRLFDIYIQEKLVRKDFNIEDESHGAQKPLTFPYNVSVTENIMEIRFSWAGKGTTRVPGGGAYGPLISALSIVSHSKPCSEQKSARRMIIVGVGFGVTALCLVIIIVGIFWWNGCFKGVIRAVKGTERQDSKMGTFTLEQIREATEDFSPLNKIGEGGFGPVYKGQLSDGTLVAVKQLSSKSRQGNREFLNEIGLVSCLQHPNLVKLHGCCIEGNQLMLVYEYMENNSLAQALFSSKDQLNLDWPTRLRICIGIAKGLAFLHEESRLKIVHRDIKATNVLLDGNLNPKISDFGLARLDDEEKTHITTRIAGTIGYMAPEYALWGRLSYKADVYSYGVVVLEVVSGKSNNNYMPSDNRVCLLDKACHLQRTERLIELVDERLGSEIKPTEAIILMKVALLCTDVSPSIRPTMSEVVNMLEGRANIPDKIPQTSDFSEDIRFKSMRDIYQQREKNQSLSSSQLDNSTGVLTLTSP